MEKKITKKEQKKIDKRELKKKDKEWAEKVKERDNYKCFICESTERIQAHHIIPREVKFLRHEVENGIVLCNNHHKFSLDPPSPHRNPLIFYEHLRKERPKQIKLLLSLYYIEYHAKKKYEERKKEEKQKVSL